MKTRRKQLIWVAGFIDGEGCIGLSRQKCAGSNQGYYYKVTLQVGQKSRAPLDFLVTMFGGTVRQKKDGYYYWMLSSRKATAVIAEIEPFLMFKTKQARVAMAFQSRRGENPVGISLSRAQVKKDEVDFTAMRKLNDRTPPKALNY